MIEAVSWISSGSTLEKQPFPLTSVYDVVSEGSNPSKRHLHRNLLQPCVLSADFSAKPARDREEQDSVYVRPIQKVPPLVLEPPAFTDLEKGSSSTVPVNSIKAPVILLTVWTLLRVQPQVRVEGAWLALSTPNHPEALESWTEDIYQNSDFTEDREVRHQTNCRQLPAKYSIYVVGIVLTTFIAVFLLFFTVLQSLGQHLSKKEGVYADAVYFLHHRWHSSKAAMQVEEDKRNLASLWFPWS